MVRFQVDQQDRFRIGLVLENFFFGELLKHVVTTEGDYRLLFYSDHVQVEVDLVVEDAAGRLAEVEDKAAASMRGSDLRDLRRLASVAGDPFILGVVLHDGTEIPLCGERLWATPLSTLWEQ